MATDSTLKASVPAHVPTELVRDFNLYDGPGLASKTNSDLHERWKMFQDTVPPIFWTPRNGGHWVLTRFDVIQEAAMNASKFSNRDIFVPQGTAPFLIPSNSDAPLHGHFRRLLNPFFSPAALDRVTEEVRKRTIELIERIEPNGECEFVGEFASIMPVVAFMSLINLPPEDLDYLTGIAGEFSPSKPNSAQAWADLSAYVNRQLDLRRTAPQDDLMSHLLSAEIDGRPLTDEEIFSTSLLVIAGGLDTVAITISFAMAFLAQSPPHRHELIEHPERTDNGINELLRRFGISNLCRVASEDLEFREVNIKAGESVLLMFPLAGLDDVVTDDPLAVDFQRKNPRHLVFGTGPHTCIGNRLAKRELRIFLEEWLKRIPHFELAPGTEAKGTSGVTNSISELRIVWTPR